MKTVVLFLMLIILQLTGNAQSATLKIIILNADSNSSIIYANIELSKNQFGTTNKTGETIFENILIGNYKLKVSHISYKTYETYLNIFGDTTIVVHLYPGNVKLGEITVTSGKYEQNLQMLPYSVSVIDSKEIQLSPAFTISDLLKKESGISLLRDGIWGTEVSIRGLSRANIVTLIDGNRIETSTDLGARLSMFDLNDIARIEVIKGSASSLYGSGATGGIINIISNSGNYNDGLNLKVNYSLAYSSVNNFISNGINLLASGNEWIAKLSGTFRKAGNTRTPIGELSNSQFEDNSFNALLRLKPLENQELQFNYQQFYAFDVGIPGAAPLFPNNATVSYPEELRRLLSAEYKINNLSHSLVKLSAKYFHQFISRDVENIPNIVQYAPAGNGQPLRRISVLKISPGADHNTDGFQTQVDFKFSNHYIIAGLDLWKRYYYGLRTRDQKIEILSSADSSVVKTIYKTIYEKPLPDADFSSAGIYVQDEMNLYKNLSLTLGGRYDFISLNNSETLNPLYETNDGVVNNTPAGQILIWNSGSVKNKSYVFNIGLLYSLNDNYNISFNASRSFRSPSLEERYQYIDLGSVVRVGDPNLKPEQGYFLDLGFRMLPDDMNISTSVFLNSLTDLVAEIPGTFENRNALVKTNIGEALLYGFEYSFYFKVQNQFNIYNTLSYVRGLNRKDELDLPQISPLNSIVGLEYFLLDLLSVDISATIFADQNDVAPGELKTPGYTTFDFKINFMNMKLGIAKINITAGVENILNKNYRNHLSTNRGFIISEPGRNIFLRTNIAI